MLAQLQNKVTQGAGYSAHCVAAGFHSPTGRALQQVAVLMVVTWLVSGTTNIAFAQGPNPAPAGGGRRAGLVQLVTMAIDGIVFAGGLALPVGVPCNSRSGPGV